MTALTFAEFYLSDGSEFINLLTPRNQSGFAIMEWQPLAPEPKDGGIFQGSPLSSGRRLVLRNYDNTIEGLTLAGRGNSPDGLIFESQRIRRLLEKAVNYWTTEWQSEPVYILARGVCETNVRYGLIYDYRAPGDGNPFASPFTGPDAAIFNEWELSLEHDAWTDVPPGESTAVQISGTGIYNSVTYGRTDTTSNEVYVANKQNKANITHIFTYDDSTTTYSANLFGSVLPYGLFPVGVAVDDILYVISDTTVTDSGPFSSLVWDIGTPATSFTLVKEYWTGITWATLLMQDNTNDFKNTGVNSMHWSQPTPWGTTTINGITGYIVRFRVTAAVTLVPTQQNRQPYSITWSNVEIEAAQVGGDIPAFALVTIVNQASFGAANPADFNRALASVRSTARGEDFTAYLNASDEQNQTGLTVTAINTAAFAADTTTPTGRRLQWVPGGTGSIASRARFSFSSAITPQYYGRFRVFAFLQQVGGSEGDFSVRMSFFGASLTAFPFYRSPTFVPFPDVIQVVDFGQVVLPGSNMVLASEVVNSLNIEWQAGNTTPGTIYLYQIVLMPADEIFSEVLSVDDSETVAIDRYTTIDSVSKPNASLIRSFIYSFTNDEILALMQTITSSEFMLQANRRQRIWFLLLRWAEEGYSYVESFGFGSLVTIKRVQRYLSMRGNR